jgi:hypothetical protein
VSYATEWLSQNKGENFTAQINIFTRSNVKKRPPMAGAWAKDDVDQAPNKQQQQSRVTVTPCTFSIPQ